MNAGSFKFTHLHHIDRDIGLHPTIPFLFTKSLRAKKAQPVDEAIDGRMIEMARRYRIRKVPIGDVARECQALALLKSFELVISDAMSVNY